MREATLNGLSDLDAVRPRKARASAVRAGAPSKSAAVKGAGARLRHWRARVTLIVASAGFSAIMVGIICNAVLFQKGHHPAPLFGAGDAVPVPRPVVREAAPQPAAPAIAPAETAAPDVPAAPPAVAPVHHAAHAPIVVHHAAAPPKIDGIARLLGLGKAVDAAPAHHAAARVRPGQAKVADAKPAEAKPAAHPAQTSVPRANAPLQLLPKTLHPVSRLAAKDHPAATAPAAQ